MRKNQNPDPGNQSDPRGDESEPSDPSAVNYAHYLFEVTYPEGLIGDAAGPDSFVAPTVVEMPTLPDSLFDTLPDFLKKVVYRGDSKEERDILLLGALVTLGSCLYNIHGIYDLLPVYPNLFLFVTGKSSSGKGKLIWCRKLVDPIHYALREQSKLIKQKYDLEMNGFNLAKAKESVQKPVMPPEKMLVIPANNSSTGVFQLLADNDGIGLIFETEGDTMAQALKTQYGNYNDGLRKGAQHESITYFRRTEQEFKEIELPRFSVGLTGTMNQLLNLVPCAENGLFSRFIFYYMNIKPGWKNVFALKGGRTLDDYYDELGQEFYTFYNELKKHPDIEFTFTTDQQNQFHSFFTQLQDKYLVLQDMNFIATVRRLGLSAFRMAMVFSALRIMETGDFSQKIECLDVDFQASLSMVSILVKHASFVYSQLPDEVMPTRKKDKKAKFFEKLPETFSHTDFIDLAIYLDIPERSARRYITLFCEKGWIVRESHGNYSKS